ncbi:hypothetical protein MBLNU230_g6912t1 [Neophaeotheca triangularis]
MQYRYALVAAAMAGVASAQAAELPECALQCFISAIGETDCDLTDSYCTCTTGQATIEASVVPCLCDSECSPDEIDQVNAYVESTCTTALEAEGETYEASTPPACPGADASETEEDAPEESAAPVPAPTEEDDSDAVATESVVAVETETAVVPVPAGTASATGAVPAASSPPAEFEGVAASNGAGFGLVAGVAALAFAL